MNTIRLIIIAMLLASPMQAVKETKIVSIEEDTSVEDWVIVERVIKPVPKYYQEALKRLREDIKADLKNQPRPKRNNHEVNL